jgi:hypothetical protein
MSGEGIAIAVILGWLGMAVVSGWIWQSKGGSYSAALLLALLFGPLVLLVVMFIRPKALDVSRWGRVVQIEDRKHRLVGTGAIVGETADGETIVEVPRSIYEVAAFADTDRGPLTDVVFKRGCA